MQRLFAFTVGPVQEFIAAARRSADLWFGSSLLSELSRTAALAIMEREGNGSLIFPATVLPDEQSADAAAPNPNVANKIVAVATAPPDELGAFVQRRVSDHLLGIARDTFETRNLPGTVRDAALTQIRDFLDYAWAAVPLAEPGDYPAARAALDRLLAARKATRDFAAVTWGSELPKSSLDGQRESVIPRDSYARRQDDAETRSRKAKALFQVYRAGPAEQLSGVDLLKRLGSSVGTAPSVPSTSHLAALPFANALEATSAAAKAWQSYLGALADAGVEREQTRRAFQTPLLGQYDGALLFEERVTASLEEPQAEGIRVALRSFLQVVSGGGRPFPYYAILVADGDSMGRAIDAQTTIERHRALSRALDGFASSTHGVVIRHRGALLYSGGDDVLALLPLHMAIECAAALAADFRTRLANFGAGGIGEGAPTLSAGLAVCHHLEPLSDALRLARSAEQAAKRVPGKNALAVTVNKRGGADRTVSGHWGELGTRLQRYRGWHLDDRLPDGFAYELRELVIRLSGARDARLSGAPDAPYAALLERAIAAEAMRIGKRKRARGGSGDVEAEVVQEVEKALNEGGAAALAKELIVARVFADAMAVADRGVQTSVESSA